jgi:hypothetical protein
MKRRLSTFAALALLAVGAAGIFNVAHAGAFINGIYYPGCFWTSPWTYVCY